MREREKASEGERDTCKFRAKEETEKVLKGENWVRGVGSRIGEETQTKTARETEEKFYL